MGWIFIMSVSSSSLCCHCKCTLCFGGFIFKTFITVMRAVPLLLAFRQIWFCIGSPGLQWGWSARSGNWSTFRGISVSHLQSKSYTGLVFACFSVCVCLFFFFSNRSFLLMLMFFRVVKWDKDICCCSKSLSNINRKVSNIGGYFD